jgi:ribosomal protein S18 acetylase RimI-like enzyme
VEHERGSIASVAFVQASAAMSEPSRTAQADDAAEVAALLERFNREFDEFTPGVEVLTPRVREHVERGLSAFLLAGPTDVGVAQLRFREYLHTGTPVCYLEELYVVPDRRGEGHGRLLMEAALQGARERGATSMELGTALDDTAARGLYESLGFTNLEKPDKPETQMLYYERDL